MKLIHYTLVALVSVLPGTALADFDAKQCQRIDDVDVPFDVTFEGPAITFSSDEETITVRSAQIEAGGKILSGPQAAPYYTSVRLFLDRARSMANAALPFSGSDATMSAAATQMCMAIVDVAASGAAAERAFPGFVSPVRVKLK